LHLEAGKIRYEAGDYPAAFQDFDKAVFHNHGQAAEPFRRRGLTRQRLGQSTEADRDLAQALLLEARLLTRPAPKPTGKPPFFDRMLLLHAGLAVMNAVVLLWIVRHSPFIHYPYFWAAATAVGLGFLEPRRGWVLALLQAALLLAGYGAVLLPDTVNIRREVEAFGVFGALGLTFVGSLIGSVLQRSMR
jgi:tetratricopeptide (TPR) repeat protein